MRRALSTRQLTSTIRQRDQVQATAHELTSTVARVAQSRSFSQGILRRDLSWYETSASASSRWWPSCCSAATPAQVGGAAQVLWLRVWVLQRQQLRLRCSGSGYALRQRQFRLLWRLRRWPVWRRGLRPVRHAPGRLRTRAALAGQPRGGRAARRGRWRRRPGRLQPGRHWRASVGDGRAARRGRWRPRPGTLTVHRLSACPVGRADL